jgi:hypothetical protein
MKLPIVRTVIATSSIVIYFRKRKLYVDDKVYKIRILPNKKVKVYQKDVVNVIGIVGTSMLCISIAEKVYFFAKDQIARHDITFKFKISKRLPPADTGNVDITDVTPLPGDPVDIVTLSDTNVLQPKNKFPIRDIVWIAVAFGITYYLGQRIDGSGLNGGSGSELTAVQKPEIITRETTQLSWWERRTMPEWMIRDLSDEGTYGQITRPTIVSEKVEPIANPRPRRFLVILFTVLRRIPEPETTKSKIPGWIYSPLFYLLKTTYRRFNK